MRVGLATALLGLSLLCGLAGAANSDAVSKVGGPADPGAETAAPADGSAATTKSAPAPDARQRDLMPVAVELDRLAGRWLVLAAAPDRFHKDCIGGATVTYTPQPGRRLQVENRCQASDGSLKLAQGILRQEAPGKPDGRLEVRYAPDWLTWLPLAWSEVWAIEVDPDKRYLVLATPDRDFVWILAPAPLEAPAYEALLARLEAAGFDAVRLRRLPPVPETTAPAGVPGQ